MWILVLRLFFFFLNLLPEIICVYLSLTYTEFTSNESDIWETITRFWSRFSMVYEKISEEESLHDFF